MSDTVADLRPAGSVSLRVLPRELSTPSRLPQSFREVISDGLPHVGLSDEVNTWRTRNQRNLWRGARKVGLARLHKIPHFYGALYGAVSRADGEIVNLGLMSLRVVTTAAVNRIVDGLQASSTDLSLWKFHGFGTGTNAEAVGDTTLQTELTTEYVTDNTRPTGSQAEGAANVYRTVGTLAPDGAGTLNITEHGVFTATTAGTLLDRSQFTAVALTRSQDSLQVTYDLTVNAGG
jgi:hypothetical protein